MLQTFFSFSYDSKDHTHLAWDEHRGKDNIQASLTSNSAATAMPTINSQRPKFIYSLTEPANVISSIKPFQPVQHI